MAGASRRILIVNNLRIRIMIGLIIAVVLALGVGGTVQVADNARPGDALFGVDQAVENLQLKLAGDEKEARLRVKFAQERVTEIDDLMDDEDKKTQASDQSDESESEDTSEEEGLSEEEQGEIEVGIESALNLLSGLEEQEGENAEIAGIVERLNSFFTSLPAGASVEVLGDKLRIEFKDEATGEEVKVKVDEKNDRLKTEIRTEEGRIKIEIKNGTLEIKSKVEDDSDDDESSSKSGLEEAEAKIFGDKTIVEVEVNDEKTTFTTSANTREAIIAAIIAKLPGLTSGKVEAVLKVEIEGADEDEDSDEEGDNDKDDDLEDEDEDNSGSGKDSD